MMAFCLDYNFLNTGYVYLFYVVDPYYYNNFGQPDYQADQSSTHEPTIARITRFRANIEGDWSVDQAATRTVILGETLEDAIPIHFQWHGIGDMVISPDGTILCSTGDGADSYTDIGDREEETQADEAIALGMLPAEHHVGSYRSQLLSSLQGKVLRIDKEGNGLPSNPYYDPDNPRSAYSRIWATGLRNPFRFHLLEETSSHDPNEGRPGVLAIGDVGNASWEELNLCTEAGQNFGWPVYEGVELTWNFPQKPIPANPLAPNPLFGQNGCDQEYFDFRETIIWLSRGNSGPKRNSCDESRFVEYDGLSEAVAPTITWSNRNWNPPARATTLSFSEGGYAVGIDLTHPDSPIEGENFNGWSALGGFKIDMPSWPEEMQGKLLFYDFSGPVQLLTVDDNWQPSRLETFLDIPEVIGIFPDKVNSRLIYITRTGTVGLITFGGNPPPLAVAAADQNFGGQEQTITFNANDSYDPNNDFSELDFRWSFPDGQTVDGPVATRTFTAPSQDIWSRYVYLTATDPEGATHTDSILVSLNNSPPQIAILSFEDGDRYPIDRTNQLELIGSAEDSEHALDELEYVWEVFLHHDDHFHPEFRDNQFQSRAFTGPPGCEEETYFLRVSFTATDPEGLSTNLEQYLYPDCDPAIVPDLVAETTPEVVNLSWTLPSTLTGDYILELQRGRDYTQINPIERFEPGTTEFTDLNPLEGSSVYRIKVISESRVINYSNLEPVNWPGDMNFTTTPNPTDGPITITYNDPFAGGDVDFTIYDMGGRKLRELRINQPENENGFQIPLDISELPSGIYWYEVKSGELRWQDKIMLR
ncbi:MAG: PQQ-dependent sugar dehydrogenase [Bacteroidota bacterium]